MRYLFSWIVKAIFFIIWLVVMMGFAIVLLFVHLWTFRNIHWKKVWYEFVGHPTDFPEESEDPKALLNTMLSFGDF